MTLMRVTLKEHEARMMCRSCKGRGDKFTIEELPDGRFKIEFDEPYQAYKVLMGPRLKKSKQRQITRMRRVQ